MVTTTDTYRKTDYYIPNLKYLNDALYCVTCSSNIDGTSLTWEIMTILINNNDLILF